MRRDACAGCMPRSPGRLGAMATKPTATLGSPSAPAIELRDLVKTFRQRRRSSDTTVTAVDHITLTVGHGEVVAFLRPNCAGKTPALELVLGLTEQLSGTVRVFGAAPRTAVSAGTVS